MSEMTYLGGFFTFGGKSEFFFVWTVHKIYVYFQKYNKDHILLFCWDNGGMSLLVLE